MALMNYKGYSATVEFDPEDHIFVGRIVGIRDIVGFHGESVTELETAFKDAVENYLTAIATARDAESSEKGLRTLGRKDRPFGLRPPTKEEMEWVESWAKRYVSRVPKGVFKYKNHEEANADWDKWMAQGRFKKESPPDAGPEGEEDR